jgi:regulator of protease activity HflC (stomatin/prohibitin superfamily)
MISPFLIPIFLIVFVLFLSIKVIPEYERAVVFRLGKVLHTAKGPGLVILIPLIDKMIKVSVRTITMDIEPQDVITRDNVSIKVNAVLYFRVTDPIRSIINIENYLYGTSQLGQTHLRSILGEHTLDELLTSREKINNKLQEILDQNTDAWGVKVSAVEVKHIDLPVDMQRAMAKEAEAERERRAKIIAAEGEQQASEKLSVAADRFAGSPGALQLRYLQTMADIASKNNTTTFIPFPIELLSALKGMSPIEKK